MCNSYIRYNLKPYMCVIVIVFNCLVYMHGLYMSIYLNPKLKQNLIGFQLETNFFPRCEHTVSH